MTSLTRDTSTTTHDDAVLDTAPLFPVDDFNPADGVALLEDRGFDPTRVRLTGLRTAEWPVEAACAGHASRSDDPWHPGPDGEPGHFTSAARQTCQGCPVRVQCLALGLALLPLGDVAGMYAGYSPSELRTIARARGQADRRVAQHGTRARYVAGCDCGPCLRAHADYYRGQRAEDAYAASTVSTKPKPSSAPVAVEPDDLLSMIENLADEDKQDRSDPQRDQGPCCQGRRMIVVEAERDLRCAAQRLNSAETPRSVKAFRASLDRAVTNRDQARAALVEHEAEHASRRAAS